MLGKFLSNPYSRGEVCHLKEHRACRETFVHQRKKLELVSLHPKGLQLNSIYTLRWPRLLVASGPEDHSAY